VFPLIATVALLLPSILHAATLEVQKWDAVVRCAEAADIKADETLRNRALDAKAILEARVQQIGSLSEVLLVTAGTLQCVPTISDDGRTLSVELSNAVALCAFNESELAATAFIKRATISQASIQPDLKARLDLQFQKPCSYGLEQLENGLLIHLTPLGETTTSPAVTVRLEDGARDVSGISELAKQLDVLQSSVQTEAALQQLNDARRTVSEEIAQRKVAEKQEALERLLEEERVRTRMANVALELKAVAGPETQLGEDYVPLAALGGINAIDRIHFAQNEIPDSLVPEEGTGLASDETSDIASDETVADTEPSEETAPDAPAVEEAEDAVAPPAPREEVIMPRPSPEEGQRATRQLAEELRELQRTDEAPAVDASGAESIQPAVSPQAVVGAQVPQASVAKLTIVGDPMSQIVNIDFREMELANVVAILAHKARINIIAGTELTGTVTANLNNVTLRQAMETVLRMNDLGLLDEEGIYRIVSYDEAVSARRVTEMVELANAKTDDMLSVLEDIIVGLPDARMISIAANKPANVIVISGPRARVDELVALAAKLDVAEPVLPTVTEAIKLNYSAPEQLQQLVTTMLTPDIGQVAVDTRARHLVVTDLPVVVEQVRELIKSLDLPVRQVSIEAMVVDAVMSDDAETGVDWVLNSIRRQSRRGENVGNLDELGLDTNLPLGPTSAGALTFGILSSEFDIRGMIQAEVRNENGNLLSNPVLVTVENVPAKISIAEEIPYIELTQTNAGGSQTNTEFKQVGTILEVTPRVTHDEHILVDIAGKESNTAGEFNGIPIEQKREIETSLRVKDGQTIFIGGLRKDNDSATVRKVPILGDIPVVNFMFRNNVRNNSINELLIFLTCNVLPNEVPALTGYQKAQNEKLESQPLVPNAQGELFHDMVYPGEMRDPMWKYRRSH
jgi:type II secretory pathway component GspD/PulD (secretin)